MNPSPFARAVLVPFALLVVVAGFRVLEATAPAGDALAATELHVDPRGDDSAPGTRDRPFATIEHAREAVRRMVARGLDGPVIVSLAGGTWRIAEPLVFGPEDGGTEAHPVTWRSEPGETAVLSGGRAIGGWKEGDDGTWAAEVAAARDGWRFRELFVGGERRPRAREPNSGYFRVARVGPDKRTSFTYAEGDIRGWEDISEVELVFLHDWSVSRIRLAAVDEAARTVTTADPVGPASPHFAMDWFEKDPRYFLEGSCRFLDAPGEWHLDASEGLLRYRPFPGETIAGLRAVAPLAEALIVVRGDPATGRPVRNLHFLGLHVEHCAWSLPPRGYAAGQACFHERREGGGGALREAVPAAVSFEIAAGCGLAEGRIAHLGGSGIWLGSRTKDCYLRRSVLTDVSGNGVLIGEDRSREVGGRSWCDAAPEEAARGQVVEDCIIDGCGKQLFGAVGVWVGMASGTRIAHNEIRNLPYTGVSLGWVWNPTPTPCKENVVEANHIHHVLQVLSDGGGIYTLGLQPGTALRGNVIHDVPLNAGRAESNGMFLDEGTTDIAIEENAIYDTVRSPLRFHRATTNLVRRNLLVVGEGVPPVRYNSTKEEDIRQVENIVWKAGDRPEELARRLDESLRRAGPRVSPGLGERERAFEAMMRGAVLEGRWCALEGRLLGKEQADRYEIRGVSRLPGDLWLIAARVQYGEKDFVVPVPVRVRWAGETPVITLDAAAIPGVGTFGARVVIHEGTYAGTWSGSDHAGFIYGVIRRGEPSGER